VHKILVCAVASPDSTAREEQFDAAGHCEGDVERRRGSLASRSGSHGLARADFWRVPGPPGC
jgi:hypothetical protein